MKLIEIDIVVLDEEKQTKAIMPFLLNPLSIIGILKTGIPGDLAGPDGAPMVVEKAAIDVGFKMILTNYTVEELCKMLEEV